MVKTDLAVISVSAVYRLARPKSTPTAAEPFDGLSSRDDKVVRVWVASIFRTLYEVE